MSKSIARRGIAMLFTVGAVASGITLGAAPANAAPAAECKITGFFPSGKVALGPNGKDITAKATTDCPEGSKIAWAMIGHYPENVPHNQTFPLYMWANYQVSQASHHQVNRESKFHLSPGPDAGNLLAGQPISAGVSGFVDTGAQDHQNEPYLDGLGFSLTLLRATRVVDFSAENTTVNKGDYIRFQGTTQRADWETHSWRTFHSHGDHLQFRADGATRWTTLAADSVSDVAETSGDYRMHYQGDDWSGASNSKAIHITVN